MKLDHFLIPYAKLNLNSKYLNVRSEAIKLLVENTGSNVFDISRSTFFLDMSLQANETKAKIHFWDYINIKSSAQQRNFHQ